MNGQDSANRRPLTHPKGDGTAGQDSVLLEPNNGASLPGLMDPEEAALDGHQPDFAARLKNQLKLHLLMSPHIAVSDGLFFDNPRLWDALREPGLKEILTSPPGSLSDDEQSSNLPKTLILSSSHTSTDNIDNLFRDWAIRPEGPVS